MSTAAPVKVDRDRAHALHRRRGRSRVRRFEQRCAERYPREKIRLLHLDVGEGAEVVGAMQPLAPAGWRVATSRDHGRGLDRDVPMPAVVAGMDGQAAGGPHGRGGAMDLDGAAARLAARLRAEGR